MEKLEKYESETDCSDMEADLVLDKVVNRLTDFVRKQYCGYLEKLLVDNYRNWCLQTLGYQECPPDNWIKECVKIYEENAIKSCMIVQFYRQTMLKTMAKIRKFTINCKLADKVKMYPGTNDPKNKSTRYVDVATQTLGAIQDNLVDTTFPNFKGFENINNENSCRNHKELSLDHKLYLFKKRFLNTELAENPIKKRARHTELYKSPKDFENSGKRSKLNQLGTHEISDTKSESLLSSEQEKEVTNYINIEEQLEEIFETKEDDIAKELDKIFQDEQTELDEIFGTTNKVEDPEISSILKEIEHATIPIPPIIYTDQSQGITKDGKNGLTRDFKLEKYNSEKHQEILKNSLWPCELHMRRQKLRDLLCKIGEEFGMQCHENLKLKFLALFGEDEEDEFAPYSPTLELDDVLLSSCKKRVAPWIVKYLMIPMTQGKIGSRLIFKKLAKKIAQKIILEEQYPSEQYIKSSIQHYFILYPTVMSLEDV